MKSDDLNNNNKNEVKKTSPIVHLILISVQFCFSGWHIIGSIALVILLLSSLLLSFL